MTAMLGQVDAKKRGTGGRMAAESGYSGSSGNGGPEKNQRSFPKKEPGAGE